MPLPVSSRSRSVVLRGRRESERGRQTRPQLLLLLFEQKTAQQTHRTSLTPRSRAHVADATVCLGFFSVVCLGVFFSSFERNLTPPKIKDKPSSFRNRECALSLRLNTPIRSVTFRSAQSLPRWVLRLLGWVRKYGKAPVGGRKLFKLMKTGLILHCCSLIWY